ncbi:MAG: sialate O-acetylesterase [Prevotella ruminicola]|uniref:Sialate O-acetylesterase n=1 Tax=Xylanibacter ruminicola TaxID=839 RepID=A0A928BQC9_XYLRU|nr:sialate O-acetylesterase [Xylanibacter ruminicola]
MFKRNLFAIGVLLATNFMAAKADVDPNFHIYLCFGQSNMEGNAQWEEVDNEVDSRFQMLATTNFDTPKRTMGNWYTANCPIVSPMGKLGPTDYFGRTMVAAMPTNVKIGVVAVAMGGSPIEIFDKDKYEQKLKDNPTEWWAQLSKNYYGSNPYGRLIEMGKKAQESGVIKGILLHQGCSNCGNPEWPNMVKKIYNDMLADLNLNAEDVPLFVGETEYENMGGGCSSHNTVVAKIPSVIPTGHVVSAEGIPGNGTDAWHFSAAGYRTLGKRYAFEALKVMNKEPKANADYNMAESLKKFFTIESFENSDNMTVRLGSTKRLVITGKFADGHTEPLTNEAVISSDDFTIEDGVLKATEAKKGVISVSYTDFLGNKLQKNINVEVSDQGPNHVLVVDNGTAGTNSWDKQCNTMLNASMTVGKTYIVKAQIKADNPGECALWPIWTTSPKKNQWGGSEDVQYLAAVKLKSDFDEYTWKFTAEFANDKIQFAFGLIGGKVYFDDVSCVEEGTTTEMVINGNFESDDLSKWEVISYNGQKMAIQEFETTSGIKQITSNKPQSNVRYNLAGQAVDENYKGIIIQNGRKRVNK